MWRSPRRGGVGASRLKRVCLSRRCVGSSDQAREDKGRLNGSIAARFAIALPFVGFRHGRVVAFVSNADCRDHRIRGDDLQQSVNSGMTEVACEFPKFGLTCIVGKNRHVLRPHYQRATSAVLDRGTTAQRPTSVLPRLPRTHRIPHPTGGWNLDDSLVPLVPDARVDEHS